MFDQEELQGHYSHVLGEVFPFKNISNILIDHLILNRRNQVNFKSNNFNKEQGKKSIKTFFEWLQPVKALEETLI